MKNSADLGGCYRPRPSACVDNTLLDLQNSSYPTQPHSNIFYEIFQYACSLHIYNTVLYTPLAETSVNCESEQTPGNKLSYMSSILWYNVPSVLKDVNVYQLTYITQLHAVTQ